MSDKPSSTADHAQHTSLLDTQSFTTREGKVSLRNASDVGVDNSADGKYRMKVYDNTDHRMKVMDSHVFDTPQDAQDAVNFHNKQVRSKMIVDESPPASVAELEQQHKNRIRRAKEIEDGSNYWSNN